MPSKIGQKARMSRPPASIALVVVLVGEGVGYVSVLFAALGCIGLHQGMLYLEKLRRSHA